MVVNCVHVGTDDIKKLKEYDVAIAGCPRFNAQLGMGIAPLEEFVRSGLRVGMGTGYAVSSGAADMLTVVRMGMLLQRAAGSRTFFGADEALRMATIDAARALHMDDKIGSLEIGKCADITAVDLSGSHQAPTDDPASALVNTCSGADVLMTMVGGDIRYEKDKWHLGVGVAKDIARVIEIRGKLRN